MSPRKTPITIASRKAKSRKAQQWVAQKIATLLNLPWGKDELIASREMGQTGVDVRLIGDALTRFPYSVEVKWQEKWDIPSAIQQAKSNQLDGTDWLVFMKKNNHAYVVVLDAEVFFQLLEQLPNDGKGRLNH